MILANYTKFLTYYCTFYYYKPLSHKNSPISLIFNMSEKNQKQKIDFNMSVFLSHLFRLIPHKGFSISSTTLQQT